MGAYPNRSGGQTAQRHSGASNTRSGIAAHLAEQADHGETSQTAQAIEPLTMRVPDACRYIGISRSTLYLLIAAGEIEIIKLGSSTLVLTESLKALISKRRSLSADRPVQIDA